MQGSKPKRDIEVKWQIQYGIFERKVAKVVIFGQDIKRVLG